MCYECFFDVFGMFGFLRKVGGKVSEEWLGFDFVELNFVDFVFRIDVLIFVV